MAKSKALLACLENNIERMKRALAGGANPNKKLNKQGHKALHVAAGKGYQEMVALLLQQPDIELNIRDKEGDTPLHIAAHYGHQEVVLLLLNQPGIDVNASSFKGWKALHEAAYNDHEEVLDVLLDHPSSASYSHSHYSCALHLAVYGSAGPSLLRRLLAHPSTDPNDTNMVGETALMALFHNDGNLVEHLQAFAECAKVDLDCLDLKDQEGRSLDDLAR